MKIIEKFINKQQKYDSDRTPTIAFLGDSVTHGCFDVFVKNDKIETYVDTQSGYPENVRTIFNLLYPDIPVNIINGGISGDNATNGLDRLERDILSFNPDLVIVCFGLNDSRLCQDGIERYKDSLSQIFKNIKSKHADVIFMTPNLMTDKIEVPFNDEKINKVVESVISTEKEEWLSKYLEVAVNEAHMQNVPVCDCNSIWKTLVSKGVNVNNLLSNRINHPTKEMHWVFAYELVKTIFSN